MTSAEQSLIQRHFAPMAGEGAFAFRDDAACVVPPPGHDLVLTVDAVVAGVHFLPDDAPGDIARKALRVNLSDLAAKGADPLGALMTLCLPREIDDAWMAAFAAGLADDLRAYGCPLLGGDTVRAPMLSISITALGVVPTGRMVRRDGARPGDRLLVSGTIGDAALGLLCRTDRLTSDAHLLDRYLRPRPRTALAAALRDHANAAMDVSDGLAGDLDALLAASDVTARVDVADVPLSEAALAAIAWDARHRETVLTGGDDYELLAAVPEANVQGFRRAAAEAGVDVTMIGEVLEGSGPARFMEAVGTELQLSDRAYSHI